MKKVFFIIFLYLNVHGYQAVIVSPVADLMGQWTEEFGLDHSAYFLLPYSPETGKFCCPRIYQALFNEVVEVEQERAEECKITYEAAFYLKKDRPCNEFYILKKCLIPLTEIDPTHLPSTPSAQLGLYSFSDNDVVLIDHFTTILQAGEFTFSAGTRFKIYQKFDDENVYHVYCLNEIIKIPKEICLINDRNRTYEEKVLIFVTLLQKWANNSKGFIPYVLGGSSNLYNIQEHSPFKLIKQEAKSFWGYPHYDFAIKSGMDCSDLVIRAAQIAGLPFFYKNTTTMEHYLEEISSYNVVIEVGDIIWFKGHVLVISDLKNNKCVESRAYSSGFGRVHEIELRNLFEGINTFDDLSVAFFNNTTLNLLDKTGTVMLVIHQFKILKLRSMGLLRVY